MTPSDEQSRLQETQYSLPYHYIPTLRRGKFSCVQHWPWGFRYLGGVQFVLDQLSKVSFSSLIDIGCGDGRLLREIANRYTGKNLLGVDVSQRAIQLAQVLNPGVNYQVLDLFKTSISQKFDVVTLIEVIEHIPPESLSEFIRTTAGTLREGGHLLLTVPHENKPVVKKHYQHFTAKKLNALLDPYFHTAAVIPLDTRASRSPLMWLIERILGAKGKVFLLTNARLLYFFYRIYVTRYLYAPDESACERLAMLCTRKTALAQ